MDEFNGLQLKWKECTARGVAVLINISNTNLKQRFDASFDV